MAARKKSIKKVNGGKRSGSGRKPVEAHFEALHFRLNALENAVTEILKFVTPADAPSKATLVPQKNGEATDTKQESLSLYPAEPSSSPALSNN